MSSSSVLQTPQPHRHPLTLRNRNLTPYHPAPSQRTGTATPTMTTGSATQTITSTPSSRSVSPSEPIVLRLRGAHEPSIRPATRTRPTQGHRRQITWAEDVVDNEGLGRKSSKVCCIYHRNREVGESSDESDSSSSSSGSESDSDGSNSPDDGAARMRGGSASHGRNAGRKTLHPHGHVHGDACGGGHGHAGKGKGKRRPSPNAYEKMPRYMNGARQGDGKN